MYYLMLKQKIKDFLTEEDGIGTVEMILILVEICTYKLIVFSVYILLKGGLYEKQ